MLGRRAGLVWICLAVIAPACFAQHPIPEAERWATITHPGNAPYVVQFSGDRVLPIGGVDYEYQIGRTEVTAAEWLEFVRVAAPYVNPFWTDNRQFTSRWINLDYSSGDYVLNPALENLPVSDVGWHFAARYANWLHNGKGTAREDFENGAYDASTFVEFPMPGQTITDQVHHNPDARYWLPTQDEWVKASHWDPNRYGAGMPGYWVFPHSSDEVPISGPPDLGGETSAGADWIGLGRRVPDVAAYRDVQSPWGLWDVSGGAREWTESTSFEFPEFGGRRTVEGTSWFGSLPESLDGIDRWSYLPSTNSAGFRIARMVPGAGSAGVFLCAVVALSIRRRRIDEAHSSHRERGVPVRVADRRL